MFVGVEGFDGRNTEGAKGGYGSLLEPPLRRPPAPLLSDPAALSTRAPRARRHSHAASQAHSPLRPATCGGCGRASRPNRGASSLLLASTCGCAAWLPTISTPFAGTPPNSSLNFYLGGHTIADRTGAGTSGPPSALDIRVAILCAIAVLCRSCPVVSYGQLNIALVKRSRHRAPAARVLRRAGAGARREDRLKPLYRALNARACLGYPAWLELV